MSKPISPLWRQMPADIDERLRQIVHSAPPCKVFFRADDIGVPGSMFSRLLGIFAAHNAPLALAVVPTWLTFPRWEAIQREAAPNARLWCWHQHGWRHRNHEREGKKQEFGPNRALTAIISDVTRGQQRLRTIMGKAFQPIFTPPWNRCDDRTLSVLADNGFAAVSRFVTKQPPGRLPLPDIPVSVDLHTRKCRNSKEDWRALFSELADGLARPVCGIMIHHQRMNDAAFVFLEILLKRLSARGSLVSLECLLESA
ncbi:polysaccharide deacetylase family protein [Desulfosarcina ovata]|uniref:NodB homology domain-containing protein n=1 Tax=Desulfosarcina ovata subsp. ovata TaxID=2752305 RepID=A0A5K8AL73_9BACT|nr:polysaccharide deacetylase family protein [Desulfosarcina ovata]BBO93451.1 hypothetical protein DSCOOX_66310 [Desulfosarcina ovata subsp. ovata]